MDEPPDWDDPAVEAEVHPYARDDKIDEAKAAVLRFLVENAQNIFYERQLSVIFEREYFHWITTKALFELVRDGSIESNTLELAQGVPIRFFRMRTNRYWKRQAKEIIRLVQRFSNTEFTRALGHQGELLVDAALPLAGFSQVARNARSFKGITWQQSGHDLDRIVEREGIPYGVEIKNTLPYIPRDELEIKLSMCRHLGLLPLFVSRMAPKNYSFEIIEAGGISWILGTQFYPFGHQQLADAVRNQLRLPVAAPARIEDGAITRLLKAINRQARRSHP
jgi:hypothetical protein